VAENAIVMNYSGQMST